MVKLLVTFPEEGSTKSSRKLVYEMCYFMSRDAVEIVTVVEWISFRRESILPFSVKVTSSLTIK